ncbi:MAG: hypothetical protein HYV03_07400 [Deltaproteobacteria bacterium]|nr:hypothetical protein [Deltaproteobacteria bacterium]
MKIAPTNNAKFAGPPPAEEAAPVQELKKQLEAGLQEIDNASQYAPALSLEDQADLAKHRALLESELAMADFYLANGIWPEAPASAGAAGVEAQTLMEQVATMPAGWSGFLDGQIAPTPGADGVYEIRLANAGVFDPADPMKSNALVYVAPEEVKGITGKTVGNDILMTIEKADGSKETYRLVDLAGRPEAIYLVGAKKTTGWTVNLAKIYRVSDGKFGQPFGEVNGVKVIGTQAADTIVGTEGDDVLIGAGGDDIIYGMMGDDTLAGDQYITDDEGNYIGSHSPTDGNDRLIGSAGIDTFFAGGGANDQVVMEDGEVAALGDLPDTAIGFDTGQWTKEIHQTTGEIVLTAKGENAGNLNVTLPKGYNMASGSQEGDDLVITLVGVENGEPISARIRVNGFFDPEIKMTVNVAGNAAQNLLDFHAVELVTNLLNLAGGKGNDVLIAPKSFMEILGVDLATLGTGTVGAAGLTTFVEQLFKTKDGTKWWGGIDWGSTVKVQNGEIVLTPTGDIADLAFDIPPEFTDAVMVTDGGDLKIILVNRDTGERAVLRIVNGAAKVTGSILASGLPIGTADLLPTAIGGDGDSDTVVGAATGVLLDGEIKVTGAM